MLEAIILGIIQGVAEWLPVSTEGLLLLVKTNFFNQGESLLENIRLILFLHLGTFLAALFYFRKDVILLFKALFSFSKADKETQNIFVFLLISTLLSGVFGYFLLRFLSGYEEKIVDTTKVITLFIGLLLLLTAYLQIKAKRGGQRKETDLEPKDALFLGIAQALAALPGLSRSGLTVSVLLMKKFNEESALRLSFLMSLPIVLAGNIVLNIQDFSFTYLNFVSLFFAFVFGYLTIGVLLGLARKINFGYFVLIFALLTLGSLFIR